MKRILSITKFFIKKYWQHLSAVLLMLVMFGGGFYCGWVIQARKEKVRIEEQDALITHLILEEIRSFKLVKTTVSTMERWAKRIGQLEKELAKFYADMDKQLKWNDDLGDYK